MLTVVLGCTTALGAISTAYLFTKYAELKVRYIRTVRINMIVCDLNEIYRTFVDEQGLELDSLTYISQKQPDIFKRLAEIEGDENVRED